MSANINKVILTGNLTRDSELRALPSGSSVLSFGIAVNDRRKNSSTGDWEDVPNYINCSMFGSRAEGLHKYLLKGTKVGIDGKLRWSSWEKDGQKHSKVDVTVDNLEFLSSRNNSEGGSYQASVATPAPTADTIPATPEITVYDADDIPF
ncbi:MAG: single-stranded DNA-binding protein [Coriobacteriales bacterium]|jgi:single-strand DNA-binding protein|nr:single-stranded DNA-binding protein [Coriobacteriales bacterium]